MDLEREGKRLLERDAEWAALSSSGQDVDRILSFWTDDARVFSYVEGALAIPGFHITWSTSEASLSPDGQLAYLLSTNAVTMPGPEEQPVTTRGRAVTVWRREPDGNWRCAVDIWNDEPAIALPRAQL
jgi:ketosteroid isomerase-like protein